MHQCRFLDKDGLCSIHKTYGYENKPLECRAWPYIAFQCQNDYVVYPAHCPPLAVNPAGPSEAVDGLMMNNVRELIETRLFLRNLDWDSERLMLEVRMLKESEKFLKRTNYIDYAAVQLQMARDDKDIKYYQKLLSDKAENWMNFLTGKSFSLDHPHITYEMTAISMYLKVRYPWVPAHLFPLILTALYVLMVHYYKDFTGKLFLETYAGTFSRAVNLAILEETPRIKKKLVTFAKGRKETAASLSKFSLSQLAEQLNLTVEQRAHFLFDLRTN